MTDREIILESRIAELETEKLGMLTTIFNLEQKTAELERRLEESCAQNVADNYLVPALSQEVDNLKLHLPTQKEQISLSMFLNTPTSSALRAGENV